MKRKPNLKNFIFLAIILISCLTFFKDYYISYKYSCIENDTDIDKLNTDWKVEELKMSDDTVVTGLWNITVGSVFYSHPVLGDVDNDDRLEVIVGNANTVSAYNGENGSHIWTYTMDPYPMEPYPALGDVDGDNKLEVVVGCKDGQIYTLNGEDGSKLWNYSTEDDIVSSPALGDVDDDGKLEVVFGSLDDNIYVLNGEDGSKLWNLTTGNDIISSPAIGDVDGDGKLEVVVGSLDDTLYVLNGENGSEDWKFSPGGVFVGIRSSPALGDVDGDNKLEVIVPTWEGIVFALNGEDGSQEWNYTTGYRMYTSPALGDMDGDDKLEVILSIPKWGLNKGSINVLNGEDGSLEWMRSIGPMDSSPALGDMDGDDRLEVIIGDSQAFWFLNGEDGSTSWVSIAYDMVDYPALGDLDDDGYLEVVEASGYLYVLKPSPSGQRIYWQGLSGDIEFSRNKNQKLSDYDYDMLSNYSESIFGTETDDSDSDNDGYSDGIEIFEKTDPLDQYDYPSGPINNPPSVPTNPSPSDGDTDVDLDPKLSVDVYDPDGDWLDIYFIDDSDDSVIGIDHGVASGERAEYTWFNLSEGNTYKWFTIAYDGEYGTPSAVWNFTINYAPDTPINPHPLDLATGIELNPTLSVEVTDLNGDPMDVVFYDASDDSVIGIDYGVLSGGLASITWSGLSPATKYEWYVVAYDVPEYQWDGHGIRSSTWSFTTNIPPIYYNRFPYDGCIFGSQPWLDLNVTDFDGDSMNISFYDASDDSLINIVNDVPSGGEACISWDNRSKGVFYDWYVKIDDGVNIVTTEIWTLVLPEEVDIDETDGICEFSVNDNMDDFEIDISLSVLDETNLKFIAVDTNPCGIPLEDGRCYIVVELSDDNNLDGNLQITVKYDTEKYAGIKFWYYNESIFCWEELKYIDLGNGLIQISMDHTSIFGISEATSLPPDDNGGGGSTGGESAIPSYNSILIIGLVSIISSIIIKKSRKLIKTV